MTVVGWLFIVFGLINFYIPVHLYVKMKWESIDLPFYMGLNVLLMLIAIFLGSVYITNGIGLLRRRFWARYIAIALMIILPSGQLNRVFIFGGHSFQPIVFVIIFVIALIMFWVITRKGFKEQFENPDGRFKLKSKHGLIIILIILIALFTPIMVLSVKMYISWKYNEPFVVIAPKEIKIQPASNSLFSDKYKRIELFDVSFLVPNDFSIRSFHRFKDALIGWNIKISHPDIKNGLISLSSESLFDIGGLYKTMYFKSAYDLERAVYTNNYSPFLLVLRMLSNSGGKSTIDFIEHPGFRGILLLHPVGNEGRFIYVVSLYDKNTKSSRAITFISKDANWNKEHILNMVSLVTFVKNDRSKADEYYKEGVGLLAANNSLDAQFKLANAYYLASEKPEYGYMFAKSLVQQNVDENFNSARAILRNVIKMKPDYKEASELLNTIGQ